MIVVSISSIYLFIDKKLKNLKNTFSNSQYPTRTNSCSNPKDCERFIWPRSDLKFPTSPCLFILPIIFFNIIWKIHF